MRRNLSTLLLALSVAATATCSARSADSAANGADEEILKAAGVGTDNKSLLEFFRRRTLTGIDQNKVAVLIRQLGDDSFQHRVAASSDLVGLGVVAVPYLREALKGSDLEVIRRAEECLRTIEERDVRIAVPVAAAHLLASRKPAGSAEVLLAYVPFADHDLVLDQVKRALAAVAIRNGKPEKSVLAALADSNPSRRALAAEVLAQADLNRAEVKKLLKDPDPTVQLRAAIALAGAKDNDAIPVLIDVLVKLPGYQAAQAEDTLLRLADNQAPILGLGSDAMAHQKCRDAWAAWWLRHGVTIDWSRLDDQAKPRGYTLVVELDKGSVVEVDGHNQPRLQINGLLFPLDAQMLPGDRVLVAEHRGDRITERNRNGDILWEKKVPSPIMAQRLPNGHTFIALQLNLQNPQGPQLLEVDRDGKEIFSFTFPQGESVAKAAKLPNGDIACVTNLHRFVRLDASGREVNTFPHVFVATTGGRIEVLPNGHAVVPEKDSDRVVEYDTSGHVAWQIAFPKPVAAVRLSNGNTLLTSFDEPLQDRPSRAVEVDREGKEVWSYGADTRITRAFRR